MKFKDLHEQVITTLVTDEFVTHFTHAEGGEWLNTDNYPEPDDDMIVHAIRTNFGSEWDEVNGWRGSKPNPWRKDA